MGPIEDKKVMPHLLNRAQRRKIGYTGHGALAPTDLGIKAYKREHPNDPKRVLYYKQEMRQALKELKENTDASEKDQSQEQRKPTKGKRATKGRGSDTK